MGSSSTYPIVKVMEIFYNMRPNKVLDVGVGSGKWGYLFREKADYRRCAKRGAFSIRIDGIELDKRWLDNPIIKHIYDRLYLEDIKSFVPEISYDIIMMGDIIEHLKKDEGFKVIDKLLKYCKILIISTPFDFIKSNDEMVKIYPLEKHISGWTHLDFMDRYKVLDGDVTLPNMVIILAGKLYIRGG